MTRAEEAEKRFEGGVNCAQAVLATYGPGLGLEEALALRVASGLEGGVGRTGRICGAANGACMALGLRYGPGTSDGKREDVAGLVGEFLKRFEAANGSVDCEGLLGGNISDEEALKRVQDEGLFRTLCPGLVRSAAEILEGMR